MKLLHGIVAGVLLLAVSGAADATSPIAEVLCEPTDRMQRKLTEQFGERRAASGLRGPEQVMEVWTDADGDWTLVLRYAHGLSCIVAMGEHWQSLDGPAAGRG
ncbi:hypothetical protein DRV85_12910 [Rhodosalinus halophilus]|uniref:Uncharacterized protein n=1 Tax=Rhodosalinus halophilus TaxID=2259333 RepID=A0A365U703_9RHOB|nr:hypothetical protein [Rhodosalinus halophilus]RBI84332.1 hypothetical protein DRV85_12910 [Rhodosalinus halophilus]